jgi:restriction endonuclease S subunit
MPEYLAWFLNQPPAQALLQSISQGSGTTMVSKAAFGDLAIDVPVLATQKQIVQLDQLRCKEAFLQKQIEQKRDQLVQAVCLTAMKQES